MCAAQVLNVGSYRCYLRLYAYVELVTDLSLIGYGAALQENKVAHVYFKGA